MNKYKVIFDKRIEKDIKKLDKNAKRTLYNWIDKNLNGCTDPRIKGKPLLHDKKGYWRYRIGNYRLLTEIEDNKLIIVAIYYKHRREVYD